MLSISFILLLLNALVLAQPNPAIPVTIGSGCETFTLYPPSGTTIPSGADFQLMLTFNQNSEYYLSATYRNLLTFYSSNGPLTYQNLTNDLNTPNYNSPAAIYLLDVTHANTTILPVNATTLGVGDLLVVTFAGSQLLPGSYLQLYIANRWMDGNYQNLEAPYLGYATYITTGGTFGTTYPTPPNPPYCPVSSYTVDLPPPTPNTSPSIVNVVASPCNGTLAGYACNWTLKVNVNFAAFQGYDQNFTSFLDNLGDIYTLQYPIRIQMAKADTSVYIPLVYQKTYTPVLEHVEANVSALSGSSMIWEESLRQTAQGYLDDFANGIASSLYLVQYGRYWQPGDPLNATIIEEQVQSSGPQSSWLGIFTYPNGTIIEMGYSTLGLRPNYRWWRAFINARNGVSCPIGSSRNVFCPMCQNEIHAWNSILQIAYGTYTANVNAASLVLGTSALFQYNLVSDSVSFFDQPTEISSTRVFVATTTIPSVTSLSQVSALTNNRLMLPDLVMNPSTPPTDWRLIPLQYFGGGCDTLDVNPQDFVWQPNLCNSPYGTCLNYGVSYWLKSNATLDQLFTSYNLLNGNFVDPTTNQIENRIRVAGSNLVLTYNSAPEIVQVFMEINPQLANFVFLQPQIGPWSFTKFIFNNSNALNFSVSNNGSASGYFFVGANCGTPGIQSLGSGQRLAAGGNAVLQLVLDATATTLTGVYTCDVFVAIRQQQFWPTTNLYQSTPYVFTLYQGCANPVNSEAYLDFDYQTWISLPNPFQNVNNPFYVPSTLPAWTQINTTTFTTIVNATVTNGGNATGTFVGTVDCSNTVLSVVQSSGNVTLGPGMNATIPVNVTAKGANVTNTTVTCSLQVQVIRQACWSTLGKVYSQNVNLSVPYDFCSTYNSGEPYLLFSQQQWLAYNATLSAPPNDSLAISVPGYWSSLIVNNTQLWSVVISASISNKGVVPAVTRLGGACPNSPVQVLSTPQSQCTVSAGQNCTASIALVATMVPSSEFIQCTLSATVERIIGDVSMCWSTLGKYYSESFMILLPAPGTSGMFPPTSWMTPTAQNPQAPSDSGLLGIGVTASIVVIVIIVLVGAGIVAVAVSVTVWKVYKRNHQLDDDDFEGFEPDEAAEKRMRAVGKSFKGPDPIPTSPRHLSPMFHLSLLSSPPAENGIMTTNANDRQPAVNATSSAANQSPASNKAVETSGNNQNGALPGRATDKQKKPTNVASSQPNNTSNTTNTKGNIHDKNNAAQKPSAPSKQSSASSSVPLIPAAGNQSKTSKALEESDSSKFYSSEDVDLSTVPQMD